MVGRTYAILALETKINTPSQSDILSILIELRYNVESTISYWNMELVKDRRVVIPNRNNLVKKS